MYWIGVGLLSVLVFFMSLREYGEDWPKQLQKKLGLNAVHPAAFTIVGMLWCLLFLAFTFGVFWTLYGIALRIHVTDPGSAIDLRWYLLTLTAVMAALGAVISLPFTLIRVALNRRQTETAEQGHITDRVNKAVEGLGATKLTKSVHETPRYQKRDGKWLRDKDGNPIPALRPDGQVIIDREIVETSEPNLEVRIGAIYSLERIAQDSERDHVQIMEILCAYIRQNAGRKDVPSPYGFSAKDDRKKWASEEREHLRPDVDVALRVIERRKPDRKQLEETKNYRLGLERVSLQKTILQNCELIGAELVQAELQGSDFRYAQLQGAKLSKAKFQGADLRDSCLKEADLSNTDLHGADLRNSKLQRSILKGANLQEANFRQANLKGASLVGADLRRAVLWRAGMQNTDLGGAKFDGSTDLNSVLLKGAAVRSVDFSNIWQITGHLEGMFGDGTVVLPSGKGTDDRDWPSHWPRYRLEYEEYYEQWCKWLADPEGYEAPEPPEGDG